MPALSFLLDHPDLGYRLVVVGGGDAGLDALFRCRALESLAAEPALDLVAVVILALAGVRGLLDLGALGGQGHGVAVLLALLALLALLVLLIGHVVAVDLGDGRGELIGHDEAEAEDEHRERQCILAHGMILLGCWVSRNYLPSFLPPNTMMAVTL